MSPKRLEDGNGAVYFTVFARARAQLLEGKIAMGEHQRLKVGATHDFTSRAEPRLDS